MYCVGLTGTIASGKSLAIDYFHSKGIDTISADKIAKSLTQKGSPVLKRIIAHFGSDYLLTHGELDRRQLREHIIKHPNDKHWLEQLLHPLIRQDIESAIKGCKSPYCVIEIPLLLDRKPYPYLNRVLLITAERSVQIQRLMMRDQCTASEASAFIDCQENNNTRRAIADDVIVNTGTVDVFYEQLEKLHLYYLKKP